LPLHGLQASVRRRDGDIRGSACRGFHPLEWKYQEFLLRSEHRDMRRPGTRSGFLYELRFQGGYQQREGNCHRLRAGRHARSARRVVPAAGRHLYLDPAAVDEGPRPSTIRPRAQLKERVDKAYAHAGTAAGEPGRVRSSYSCASSNSLVPAPSTTRATNGARPAAPRKPGLKGGKRPNRTPDKWAILSTWPLVRTSLR